MAADARLQRQVTVEETGIALDALLQKLSAKDLTLTCSRSCASQKLQVRLVGRPLRTLLEALAQLLPGAWEPLPDKQGYRLEMSAQAVHRREEWWRLFLAERQAALAAQSAFLLAEMRATPNERPETVQGLREGIPYPESKREFFNALPGNLQERIASQINDTPFYTLGMAEFTANDNEGAILVNLNDLPAQAQQIARKLYPNLPADTLAQFTNGTFTLGVDFIGPDGQGAGGVDLQCANTPAMSRLWLDQTQLVQEVHRLGRAAPTTWKQLAAYQESRFWENAPPMEPLPQRFPPPNRADVLRWLADQAHIEFVADYYSLPGITLPGEMQQRLTRPVEEELNFRAAQLDSSWKRVGDIYLLRDNRWYRDDYLEVPAPLAQKWLAQRAASKQQAGPASRAKQSPIPAQLEWEAAFAGQLTRWQIANGLKWLRPEESHSDSDPKQPTPAVPLSPRAMFPFYSDADETLHEYNLARFYASLDSDARAALLEKRLAFASLTPEQKQQALFLTPTLRAALAANQAKPVMLGVEDKSLLGRKISLVFSVPNSPAQ
ncbi:MAG TPA: hypothetical protein VFB38_13565 [Chthonomonadaceae bacterium]|nr:hypothetical protein [Chthonomonadaceae bacterium]